MTVDGFRLVGQLTGGRHGAVWHAVTDTDDRPVALKQLLGVDTVAFAGIRDEVDRLRRLADRHVVGSHPPVTSHGEHWLVEDWVDGVSLAAVLAGSTEPLARPQALGIVRGALLGLTAAHRVGLSHGELSPRSVMIDTEGQPVLVGFAAHLADGSVADSDGFAGPEAAAAAVAGPRSDVYAAGRIRERLLATEGVPTDLLPVVERATASDPAHRYPDAGSLLADLEVRAERAYGAGWWTTAGLSGLAATATGVSAAGTVGAAASGSGAVTGVLSSGSGALAGASHTAGGGVVRAARSGVSAATRAGLVIAGTAVVLIALVVGAAAILRPSTTGTGTTDTAAVGPTQGSGGAPASQPPPRPTPTPTPTPTPRPTPTPNPTLEFTGTYRYDEVVTKSNDTRTPVGDRYRTTWTVSTTCAAAACSSSISVPDEEAFTLDTSGGRWRTELTYRVECVDSKTGEPTDQKVRVRYTRTLQPKTGTSGVLTIAGTSRYRQLKKCTDQSIPQQDVHRKITVTRVK